MAYVVSATHRRFVFAEYSCEGCGHADHAAVHVRSTAGAQTGMMVDIDEAKDLAHGTAHGGAEDIGEEYIALAPCPVCHQRDELAVKNFRRKGGGFLGAGVFFTTAGIAGAIFATVKANADEMAMIGAGFFGVPGVVLLAIGLLMRFRKIPNRGVIFHSVDPRPWQALEQQRGG